MIYKMENRLSRTFVHALAFFGLATLAQPALAARYQEAGPGILDLVASSSAAHSNDIRVSLSAVMDRDSNLTGLGSLARSGSQEWPQRTLLLERLKNGAEIIYHSGFENLKLRVTEVDGQ